MAATKVPNLRLALRNSIFCFTNIAECKTSHQFVRCGCLFLSRNFRRYNRIPKKFLESTKKDRNKVNRDDVFFIFDQVLPAHSLQEAIDTFKAYDLFGGEPIDILLKVDLNTGKVTFFFYIFQTFNKTKHLNYYFFYPFHPGHATLKIL